MKDGSLNDEPLVRSIVTKTIRRCSKSREVIAEQMSDLCADRITVRMLNSYTSASAEQHRFPMQYVRAFCQVTGDWALLECVVDRSGFRLIGAEEIRLLELGKQYLIRKRAEEQSSRIAQELSGVSL